jgi:hypothetical protein
MQRNTVMFRTLTIKWLEITRPLVNYLSGDVSSAAEAWNQTLFRLTPRLRLHGVLPPFHWHLYDVVLIKNRDNSSVSWLDWGLAWLCTEIYICVCVCVCVCILSWFSRDGGGFMYFNEPYSSDLQNLVRDAHCHGFLQVMKIRHIWLWVRKFWLSHGRRKHLYE